MCHNVTHNILSLRLALAEFILNAILNCCNLFEIRCV